MNYVVQTGDTISAVTQKLNTSFAELKRTNPKAFGRTSNGRWFLYAGVEVSQSSGKVQSALAPAAAPARPKPNAPATEPVRPPSSQPVLSDAGVHSGTYVVQPGETVTGVSRKLGQPFSVLKALNPEAVGRTKDGRWFFFAGATLEVPSSFNGTLVKASKKWNPPQARPAKTHQATSYAKPETVQQFSSSRSVSATPQYTTQTTQPVYHSLVGRGGSTRTQTSVPRPPAPVETRSQAVRSPARTSSAPQQTPQPAPRSYQSSSGSQALWPALKSSRDDFEPRIQGRLTRLKADHNMAPVRAQEQLVRLRSRVAPQVDLSVGVVKDNLPREGLNGPGNFFQSGGVTVGFRIEF
jgi:LysM repeat protein